MRDGPPSISLVLDMGAKAPGAARRAMERVLAGVAAVEFVGDAILLTSELVTNAVVYAPGAPRLCVWFDLASTSLRVEVDDVSFVLPAIVDRPAGHGGLGLKLIDRLATRWGASPTETGKTVWFELQP